MVIKYNYNIVPLPMDIVEIDWCCLTLNLILKSVGFFNFKDFL